MGNFAVFFLYIFNGFAFACLFWFSDFSRFGAKKSVKKKWKSKISFLFWPMDFQEKGNI